MKKTQHGLTLLLLTVTLLLISTLLILFAAEYGTLQQKISSDLYRSQQAFEAAQAGLEAAIPYFQTNYSAIEATASGGHLSAYVNSNTANVALANGSSYSFVYTNPTVNNYQLITITSTGVNADGTSTRVLQQQIQAYTQSMPPPSVSLSTQGAVALYNSAKLNNSTTNSNINAGGNVFFNNSANSTTSSGVTSDSSHLGSDVQQNNSSLSSMSASNYFQSIFDTTSSTVESNANYTYSGDFIDSYDNLNGVTGATIWINESGVGYIDGNTTIGSPTKPVILVVNGNMSFLDNVTIYGFVFILNPAILTLLSSNVTINGGIASTGPLLFLNSATVNYNSAVLNALPSVGGPTSYAKLAGSWRDF